MATPDNLTLIISAFLLLMAALTPLCSALFRRPRIAMTDESNDDQLPPLSVVMTADDNSHEVERNLPALLGQDYGGGFEVVVVIESSNEETKDALKRMQASFPQLYVTYIPDSSHYLSRRKLALTVGFKAAKHEWIVMTDIHCRPSSAHWLTSIGRQATADNDLVLGHTTYADDAPAYWRLDRLETMCRQLRRADRSTPYRYEGRALAFRRSAFMAQNGFLHNLKYLRGEFDFLANELGQPGRAAIANEPDAWLVEDKPSRKAWTYDHLYYLESRRHMKRSFGWRLLANTDQWLLHLNFVAGIAALAWAVAKENWWLTGAAAVAVILAFVLRTVIARRAARDYGVRLPLLAAPLLELCRVWRQLYFLLRYRTADKYDFIRR